MKKLSIFLFAFIIILTGCSKNTTNTPKGEVQKLFSDYNSLSSDVLIQLDSVMASEDLTDEQINTYKNILKRQYEDLKYKITDEVFSDDKAIVTAEIEVYDLRKVIDESEKYLETHESEFYDENETIDTSKFWDYKLKGMKEVTDRVKYTIDFTLTKIDNEWQLDNLLETDRQKIHGLYK